MYTQYPQPSVPVSSTQQPSPSVFPTTDSIPAAVPVNYPTTTMPVQPNAQGYVLPNNVYSPAEAAPAAPNMGADVLKSPDAQYFAPTMNPAVNSPYPMAQQPKGKPIKILVDYNQKKNKEKSALAGVGIGVAASIVTGGLLLPVIAGAVAYNLIKDSSKKHFMAYPNSYVYELRAAIAADLNIKPELILLERKDMIMDDNEQLQKYIKKDKEKATVNVSVQQTPVAGSNYYAPNGCVYPAPMTVMRVQKDLSVCFK